MIISIPLIPINVICSVILELAIVKQLKHEIMKTIKLKKLLVPFELNENYTDTLSVAKELSNLSGASITLVNVVSPIVAAGGDYIKTCTLPLAEFDLYLKEQRLGIEKFVKSKSFANTEIDVKIEIGNFNKNIIELCRNEDFDLIVLPDFQKTPLDRLLSDINPLLIMEKTKTAVISINNYAGSFKIKKIMLPLRNVMNWFNKIPFVVKLAKITGARIFILGVANSSTKKVQQNILKKIEICSRYLEKHDLMYEVDTVFGHGEPYFDVLMESKFKGVDLIAVSSPAEFAKIKSLFNTNFYNQIITHGSTPVLGIA